MFTIRFAIRSNRQQSLEQPTNARLIADDASAGGIKSSFGNVASAAAAASAASAAGGGPTSSSSASSSTPIVSASPPATSASAPAVRKQSHVSFRTDGSLDYDALYEDECESDLSMESHGNVMTHLLSQVKIGMDLTKVVLPTFILERRSLLEMYADNFAHPDLFLK